MCNINPAASDSILTFYHVKFVFLSATKLHFSVDDDRFHCAINCHHVIKLNLLANDVNFHTSCYLLRTLSLQNA